MGLQIVEPEEETSEMKTEEEKEGEEEDDDDLLSDLPDEALRATTRAQFVHHMRPYMWVKFPSAMASEITAFINARWNLLKASKKVAAGGCGMCGCGLSHDSLLQVKVSDVDALR